MRITKREGAEAGGEPEAGGLGAHGPAAAKRFFLIEYADEVRRGFRWMLRAPRPDESVVKRVSRGFARWSKLRKARLGSASVVGIVVLAYVIFSAQAGTTALLQAPPRTGGPSGPGTHHAMHNITDTVGENSEKSYDEMFNETKVFKTLTIVLTWTDESSPPTQVNQPDSLGLKIVAPNGKNYTAGPATNPQNGQGKVTWSLNDTGVDVGGNNWKVTVVGGNMGDNVRPTGRPCFPGVCPVDRSNAFDLVIDYTW